MRRLQASLSSLSHLIVDEGLEVLVTDRCDVGRHARIHQKPQPVETGEGVCLGGVGGGVQAARRTGRVAT